jgi:hypothetical protein
MRARVQPIEIGLAVLPAHHRFAVDRDRAGAKRAQRLDDEREAIGQVIARTAVELHPLVVLTGYDPKPVVLDFVQPDGAGGRLRG